MFILKGSASRGGVPFLFLKKDKYEVKIKIT